MPRLQCRMPLASACMWGWVSTQVRAGPLVVRRLATLWKRLSVLIARGIQSCTGRGGAGTHTSLLPWSCCRLQPPHRQQGPALVSAPVQAPSPRLLPAAELTLDEATAAAAARRQHLQGRIDASSAELAGILAHLRLVEQALADLQQLRQQGIDT